MSANQGAAFHKQAVKRYWGLPVCTATAIEEYIIQVSLAIRGG